MKTRPFLLAAALFALPAGPLAAQTPAAPAASPAPDATAAPAASTFKSDKEKVSYAIGMNVGQALKAQGVDVDVTAFSAAVRDMVTGAPPLLSNAERTEVLTNFGKTMSAKVGGENKAAGEKFLADNKAKPGVQTLPDGLQYKVLKEGSGPSPKATDTVTVNYRGTLIDGTEFDSSYKRNEPASFPLGGVIKAWTEALQLMKVGSKYQLFVPSELAYGDRGAGQDIKPGSTLIFEVELLGIK